MKGEVSRILEILEGAKDENGCVPMALVRQALKKPDQRWIPCSERLPEEYDSIFSKFYGTDKWRKCMFRKRSEEVIVTLEFEDGARSTEVMLTIDGKWDTSNYSLKATVIAWMPLPEPYKGKE